jgi:hypothetical protein
MDVKETPVVEKRVDGEGQLGPHPEHRAVFVGSGPQMGDGS